MVSVAVLQVLCLPLSSSWSMSMTTVKLSRGDGGGCVGVASPGSVPSSVRLSLMFLVVCLVEVDSCLETWWWGVGGMVNYARGL